MSRVSKSMEAYNISLQVGSKTLAAGPELEENLLEAIQAHNARTAVDGLDPELCPGCLSERRVRAFVMRLPELDQAQLEAMQGKSINLTYAKLYLSETYPVEVSAIESCNLDVKSSNSPIARPIMLVPFKASEAIRLAEKARAATQAFDAQVKSIQQLPALATETDGALKNQLKTAEVARFYAATVWQRNAEILAKDLQLATWEGEAQSAKEAMTAYQVLVSAAMPTN